jgi:hypothetical protein
MLKKKISKILLKYCHRYLPNKIINPNNSNNLNNNVMSDNIIFEPGIYQFINSLESSEPKIIRIIGQIDDNNYKTQDGQIIPYYVLLNDYVKIDAYSSKEEKENKLSVRNKLFSDFEPIKINKEIKQKEIEINFEQKLVTISSMNDINDIVNNKQEQSSFDISIFNKITVENLNKKNNDKFGEQKYKNTKIPILLELDFPYDIDKLKTAIEILDLDENIVLTELVKRIKFDYSNIIINKLKELFEVQTVEAKNNLLSIENQEINEIIIDINLEIEKIDNLINKF